jgi:hypothetical protein
VVLVDAYPQLAFVAWNRRERRVVEREAFALYESNRQWIDPASMTAAERSLFDALVARFANGAWLG